MPYHEPMPRAAVIGATANTTVSIPPAHAIDKVIVHNTTANAVTGGLRIGTSAAGTDVVVALTVGANALVHITDSALLKRVFSMTASQTLFLEAVTAWNSANLNVYIPLIRLR